MRRPSAPIPTRAHARRPYYSNSTNCQPVVIPPRPPAPEPNPCTIGICEMDPSTNNTERNRRKGLDRIADPKPDQHRSVVIESWRGGAAAGRGNMERLQRRHEHPSTHYPSGETQGLNVRNCKDGEHWIAAPAINPHEPIMIAECCADNIQYKWRVIRGRYILCPRDPPVDLY